MKTKVGTDNSAFVDLKLKKKPKTSQTVSG